MAIINFIYRNHSSRDLIVAENIRRVEGIVITLLFMLNVFLWALNAGCAQNYNAYLPGKVYILPKPIFGIGINRNE